MIDNRKKTVLTPERFEVHLRHSGIELDIFVNEERRLFYLTMNEEMFRHETILFDGYDHVLDKSVH